MTPDHDTITTIRQNASLHICPFKELNSGPPSQEAHALFLVGITTKEPQYLFLLR